MEENELIKKLEGFQNILAMELDAQRELSLKTERRLAYMITGLIVEIESRQDRMMQDLNYQVKENPNADNCQKE